jgi:hypothetical protein
VAIDKDNPEKLEVILSISSILRILPNSYPDVLFIIIHLHRVCDMSNTTEITFFIHDLSLVRKVGRYTSEVIRNLNLEMERQCNNQEKKDKKTNNEDKTLLKIEQCEDSYKHKGLEHIHTVNFV